MKRIAVCFLAFCLFLAVCVSFSISAEATPNVYQAESGADLTRNIGTYVVGNGVTIPNSNVPADGSNKYCQCGFDVGAAGHWCCWWYGYYVYYHIWGVYPNRYDDSTHYLRNLSAADRTLTAEHLKTYLRKAKPGALLRIDQDATPSNGDNNGHTLVFVKMNNSGDGALFLEGNYDNCGRTRLVEWSFNNLISQYGPGSYFNYQYIKYISWPNAPEYTAICSHSYTPVETSASCTDNGICEYTCSLCGDSYSETIPATGHSYGEWSVDTEASCTLPGIEKKICSTCGETASQEVPAIGHSYIAKHLGAQCGDYPKTRYTCEICGDSYDEYSDDIYSDWVTELPEGVDPDTVEIKTEYRYQTMQTATGSDSTMDGWTFLDTVYGEWANAQTTTGKPAESDTLRIVSTVQTSWGYYHWCNYYSNCWNVDSIAYGSTNYWHGYASNVELPAISFPDQGGNQAYGGTGTAASPCAYNFYIWFRNPDTDTFSYTYETRELLNRFYKWSDWSAWSEDAIQEDEQTNVETRTLYRYITAEKGEHQYVTVETPPTFAQSGAVTHTCTLCNDVIVDVLPKLEGKVSAWNVSLEDDIHVIFHMNISQSIEDTARVRIHVGEEGYTYLVSDLEKTSDGLYVAGVHIAAAQMSDYIFVTVLNDGSISDTQAYTVKQYANTILADESQSRYHAIVKEMLNYGAAAQDYFDYERKNPANTGITGAGSVQIPDSVDEGLSITGEADGISLYAASLVFRNKIAVRFYFKCDGNINAYTFYANGNACMPQLKDGCFFVELADILPQNMDRQVELTVTDGNGESMTVSYSPMNYIVRMNEKGSETLKALVKALYNYHLAAKALSTVA